MSHPLRVLTIAGSDSAGCAGAQADLRTFGALKAHGLCALTAVTAQDTSRVAETLALPPQLVRRQIQVVSDDIGFGAVKIGMLPNGAVVEAVAETLARIGPVPVVLDPVLSTSGGDSLGDATVATAIVSCLLGRTTVITPNLAELEELTGVPPTTPTGVKAGAIRLLDCGVGAVIVTGGHGADPESVTDLVFEGDKVARIVTPRLVARHSRGTGCTHSAALAVGLARRLPLPAAARLAQQTVCAGLKKGYELGSRGRLVLAP